jgi:phosphoglycerate dehydrogenase-like enzyme
MRIAILDDYQRVATSYGDWALLGSDVELEVLTEHVPDELELSSRLAGCEVVVAMRERTPFRRSLLERLPDLRLLVTTGHRNASIDVAAAHELGVVVCGTRGSLASTAELTWALILALLRHVPEEDRAIREGGWQTTIGTELNGRRLGVVGLGNLGTRVARIGLAFELEVVAWSQNLTPERCEEVGVGYVGKDELFETADVISIHLKLSDRTRGLIGAADLARMKSAVLVNTSRGPIVEEAALVEALRSGAIGGVALDVYDVEPLPTEHPLRTLPNTVLTPHLGYVTSKAYEAFYGDAAEDIRAWRAGSPVRVIDA